MLPLPWIVVFTVLATNPQTGTVSTSTNTARFGTQEACQLISRDYTYKKIVEGIILLGSARCYQD